MPPPNEVFMDDLLGVLRLSQKYAVPYLHRHALQHMATRYHFNSVHDYASCRLSSISFRHSANYTHLDQLRKLLDLIATVIEVGAQWFLPTVYYHTTILAQHL